MSVPIHLHQNILPTKSIPVALLTSLLFAVLTGCSHPVEKVEEVRPVRAMTITAGDTASLSEFSGDVRPRIESKLAFRVGGKIVTRKVEVGNSVKRGQVLMQLDPQDLKLAQLQAVAGLRAAQGNRDLAKAELQRYQELRAKNFVSQAILDAKQTALQAAQASYDQAQAASKNQSNQTGYTTLLSDLDGVVTAIDAEAGQVVAAGATVVKVAQTTDKDIVIGIPEDQLALVRQASDVRVHVWSMPGKIIAGKLRELAPVADPASRTYTAKISLPAEAVEVRLGMTAYVTFVSKTPQSFVKVPLTALWQHGDASAVWVIEHGTVHFADVTVAGPSGNDMLLASGVTPGQTIVTAGVNLLKPAQKVSILDDDLAQRDAALRNTSAAAPLGIIK